MRVLFRTDAGPKIGVGHLMRCLALATGLRSEGASCVFMSREELGPLARLISDSGHSLLVLPAQSTSETEDAPSADSLAHANWLPGGWQQDAAACLAGLAGQPPADWLVVDHYAIDIGWERRMRTAAGRIMVIDDLADRSHDCDVLLDQNLFPDLRERYAGYIQPGATMLLGPEYALLRDEFAARRAMLDRKFDRPPRLFVGFGGADPTNATGKVVSTLLEAFGDAMEMVVVAGPANPHFNDLQAISENKKNVRLYKSMDRMAECLADADLAIGGGGVNALERCAMGLPSLVYAIADNQIVPSHTLSERGGVRYMGQIERLNTGRLVTAVSEFVGNAQARADISRTGMALVDAAGVSRVVKLLIKNG